MGYVDTRRGPGVLAAARWSMRRDSCDPSRFSWSHRRPCSLTLRLLSAFWHLPGSAATASQVKPGSSNKRKPAKQAEPEPAAAAVAPGAARASAIPVVNKAADAAKVALREEQSVSRPCIWPAHALTSG